MEKNLGNKISGAIKWSTITEISTRLVVPVVNVVLVRLLEPSAFGVVATLTIVTSFAEIFTDAGFQKYLVQHDFSNDSDLEISTNVAFWTNIFLSFFIWGGIAFFASPIANIVGSPGYERAIVIMSAEIPLLAFSSIQIARYKRAFDFKNLFFSRIVVAFVPLVVTVPLALLFRSYWALVIGTLAKDILNAIILTVKSTWHPTLNFSIKKLKDMISFSLWSVLENITIWLSTNLGTFIVGNILGQYYLGLYKTTISTVSGYFNIIQGAVMPVLFSALSRCQAENNEFRKVFYKFQRMMATLVFPLGFGVFVYRELAVTILLGKQWDETSLFFGIESLVRSFLIIFSYFNSEAFRSKGRPRLSALAQCLYLLTAIPVLVWSSYQGYVMLSVLGGVVGLLLVLFTSILARITVNLNIVDSFKNVLPSLISSLLMAIIGELFLIISTSYVWQFISIILCAVIYFVLMIIIPKGRRQLLEIPILCNFVDKIVKFVKQYG